MEMKRPRLPATSLDPEQSNLFLIENVGQMAAATILSIMHGSHEDTSTTVLGWALAAETLDLAITVNLVVLEYRQLGLLSLVLDLLWGGVDLLLSLLGSTTKTEDEM